MTMSGETVVPRELLEVRAPVFQRLQVIVSLNRKLRGGVNGRTPFEIDGSGVCLVWASGCDEGYDRFEPNTLQRAVWIGIDALSSERSGCDIDRIASNSSRRLCSDDVLVLPQPLTPGGQTSGGLSGCETDRLWQAREPAELHCREPLTLHELARQVGANVKKLTIGFRQQFGRSVFEYIQQYRLQEAYRMLSAGGYSMSEVATFLGHAIPHFSTRVRKSFGVSPLALTY